MNALKAEHTDTFISEKNSHGISIWLNDRDMTINCQLFIDTENGKIELHLTTSTRSFSLKVNVFHCVNSHFSLNG